MMHKFCRSFANLAVLAFIAAGLSLVAPTAEANTILFQLDDLTNAIHNKVYNNGILVIDNPTCCDMISGLFHFSDAGSAGLLSADVNIQWNIYEPDATTLSDTLSLVGTGGTNGLQIDFVSDAWPTLVALSGAQSVIETGTWQTALNNIVLSNGDTFTFQFRSAETPLPGAVWLFASVLAGAAGLRKWLGKQKGASALAAACSPKCSEHIERVRTGWCGPSV
jgi:hypothetical protein